MYSLNALSGIGGVRTNASLARSPRSRSVGLNALSGIGGVRTKSASHARTRARLVLMPCRALEAFGLWVSPPPCGRKGWVLMPCRALEAFGLKKIRRQEMKRRYTS